MQNLFNTGDKNIRMSGIRIVGAGSIGLAGVVGSWFPVRFLLAGGDSVFGIALALLGVVLGIVIVAASVLLYRSDVAARGVTRIAGWHLFGIAVLGLILTLIELYVPGALPLFAAADIVLVSAFAHLLIGYNDVRQIRADELADKNQRLDVLSQVLRHNLRTEAQVLLGYADRIQRSETVEEAADAGAQVQKTAESLARLNEKVGEVYWAMDFEADDASPTPVESTLESVANKYRDQASVTVDYSCPVDASVLAGDRLEQALGYLVNNAVGDTTADPEVTLAADAVDKGTEIRVESPGGRITDDERELLEGDAEITQLNHSRDIDLWAAQWIVSAYGGRLRIAEDAPGSCVAIRLLQSSS